MFVFENSLSDSSLYNNYSCDLIAGSWAKKILLVVSKKYPAELRAAVPKFLEVCVPTLDDLFSFVFVKASSESSKSCCRVLKVN